MEETDLPPSYSSVAASADVSLVPQERVEESDNDVEALLVLDFKDETDRVSFIQKVHATILLQSLLVLTTLSMPMLFDDLHAALKWNTAPFISVSLFVYAVVTVLLVIHNKKPEYALYRYSILVIYPLAFGVFLTVASYLFWPGILCIILPAWIYLCTAFFTLIIYSIFSLQTNVKFTVRNGMLIIVSTFFVLYVACIFMRPAHLSPQILFGIFYCSLVTFVLSCYKFCDVMIMTGKFYHTKITPADFIMAALYTDTDYYYIFMLWFEGKLQKALEG